MKGHTLIELLLVLTITAILVFFAVSGMQHLFLINKANTQLNQLLRLFTYARNAAIIKNKPILVCPAANNAEECGEDWAKGINIYLLLTTQQKILLKSSEIFSDVNLNWNRSTKRIIFSTHGSLQSQNGSFTYQLSAMPDYSRKIILSSTGRVRIANSPN